MNIPTKEETFEHQLKNALTRMIADSGLSLEEVLETFETLENFIEADPREFGRAMSEVTFDFMGSEDLASLMDGE